MIVSRKAAEAAAEVFGFDIESGLLDAEQVNAAYRTEAKRAHPDAGGSMEAFAAIDRAKHILLRWLERPAAVEAKLELTKCTNYGCVGGIISTRRGFGAPLRRTCPRCRGTGDLDYEHEKGGE